MKEIVMIVDTVDNLCNKALKNTDFRYLRNAEEVACFVGSEGKCFCYGAGAYGKRFVRYCRKHELKLGGFIVSDDKITEKRIMDMPVYHLCDIIKQQNIRIIVTVNEMLHLEIANELFKYKDNAFAVKYLCNVPQFMIDDFEKEVAERCSFNLLEDYEKIADEFSDRLISRDYGSNVSYGHAHMMKRLLGIPSNAPFPDRILHGLGWTGHILYYEIDYNNYCGNKIYVSGKQWRDYLATLLPHKKIIDIGNYIRYEKPLYGREDFEKYKTALGRTLLVFPYHSIRNNKEDVKVSYEIESLIEEIEKRKVDFDSVMVCMYYYDVQIHNDKPFKKKGYKIVTAGHMHDYNFTRRLRSIIELSDVTMSNSIGSHLPYCVCLKKPHYLFKQNINFNCEDAYWKGKQQLDVELYSKDYNGRYFFNLPIKEPSETARMYKALEECFSKWTERLTDEQIELVTYVYGDMSPISEKETMNWYVES